MQPCGEPPTTDAGYRLSFSASVVVAGSSGLAIVLLLVVGGRSFYFQKRQGSQKIQKFLSDVAWRSWSGWTMLSGNHPSQTSVCQDVWSSPHRGMWINEEKLGIDHKREDKHGWDCPWSYRELQRRPAGCILVR